MKKLFSPAIWLVGRLSFPHKLLLTAAAFIIPLLILASLLFFDQQRALASIQQKRSGLAVQLPALHLLGALHEHHAAWQAAFAGDESLARSLPQKIEDVERALKQLEQLTQVSFPDPRQSYPWDEFAKGWRTLAADSPHNSDGLDEHIELSRRLSQGLTQLSDASGLRADSDPAIAALVDSLSVKLPMLVNSLAQARDIGLGVIISKRMKAKSRNRLLVVRGGIGPLIGWNFANIEKAIALRPTLTTALEPLLSTLGSAPLALQEALTTKVIDTTDFDITPDEYYARGAQAIAAAITMAAAISPELDQMLALREADLMLKRNTLLVLFALVLIGLAYGFIAAYTSIVGSINDLSRAALTMTDGDLRVRVIATSNDEIGSLAQHFNTMAEGFSFLISKTVAAASDLTHSTRQVMESNQQIENATEQQNEAAARTAGAVQQLTVSIHEVAEHARETERISQNADKAALDGVLRAAETAQNMERIVQGVHETLSLVHVLEERSLGIGHIVKSITEIADQTNMLALNAAIEAARAGDHGRGFSVVADEVRKLAESTRQATHAIAGTISLIQSDIDLTVRKMQHCNEQVASSSSMIDEQGQLLGEIRRNVSITAKHIIDIVSATAEQSKASSEIARNTQEIAVMAEQSHASARSTSETARQLSGIAARLSQSVNSLAT